MPIPTPVASPALPGTPGTILQRRWALIGADVQLGAVDQYGTKVWITDISGWEGASGTTSAPEQRAADHGAWLNRAYSPARVVQIDILMQGADFATVNQSLRRLVGSIPLDATDQLLISDHDVELVAQVRQEGDVLATQKAATARASLSLLAPDPRRYSSAPVTASTGLPATIGGLRLPARLPARINAQVISGLIVVENEGTTDSPPVFTVRGPAPVFSIVHRTSGRSLRYHEAVPAGHTVVIDTAARTALLDGVAPRYVSGSWFSYAPGTNEVFWQADTASAAAVLLSVHRHAWK